MEYSKRATFVVVGLTFIIGQLERIASETHSSLTVDVVVVTDINASQDSEEALVLQTLLKLLSDQISVSEDGSHMSLVSVGSTTDTLLNLSEGVSIDAVANAFAEIQSGDGSMEDLTLDLSSAMQKAYDDILSQPDNRPDVPDVVVAVTGRYYYNGHTAVTHAVTTAVVTVGDSVDVTVVTGDGDINVDERIEEFLEELRDIQRRLRELLERLRELEDDNEFTLEGLPPTLRETLKMFLKDEDDNDIPDGFEQDLDEDGIPDYFESDNDQNGTPDHLDDTDGDGTPDIEEDDNNNGIPDLFEDDDNDGLPNIFDPDQGGKIPEL